MAEIKKLNEEEYSESRKNSLKEVKVKTNSTTYKIIEVLGNEQLTRKELREKSGLTLGQIAGAIYKSQKTNGKIGFENGKFFVKH